MSYIKVTDSKPNFLITVENVKEYLGISASHNDNLIQSLIDKAIQDLSHYMNHSLSYQRIFYMLQNRKYIPLYFLPIININYVYFSYDYYTYANLHEGINKKDENIMSVDFDFSYNFIEIKKTIYKDHYIYIDYEAGNFDSSGAQIAQSILYDYNQALSYVETLYNNSEDLSVRGLLKENAPILI